MNFGHSFGICIAGIVAHIVVYGMDILQSYLLSLKGGWFYQVRVFGYYAFHPVDGTGTGEYSAPERLNYLRVGVGGSGTVKANGHDE